MCGYVYPFRLYSVNRAEHTGKLLGDDNNDQECISGAVSYIFEGSIDDHYGPYMGIIIDSDSCV